MILRTYEPSDRQAVWAIHNLALDGAGANDPGPWDNDLDRVETCYFDGGDFLVGYDGERLVAMGGLRRIDEATGEIRRMRAHPCFQRQGLGQAVLTALEERARQLGYTRVVLDTSDRQEAARALYEKNDYRETGREKCRVGETRVLLVLYEKDLTRTAVDLEPQP